MLLKYVDANQEYIDYIKENLNFSESFNFTHYSNLETAKESLVIMPNFENIKNFIKKL